MSSPAGANDNESAARLTPPPRAPSADASPRRAGSDRRSIWALALTGVGLIGLAATAALVFFLLPEWIEGRSSAGPVTVTESAPTGAVEDPLQPLPPVASGERVGEIEPVTPDLRVEAPAPAGRITTSRPARRSAPPDATPVRPAPAELERAIGEGMAALAVDDAAAARQAFTRALALAPDSAPATAGLARAEEALLSERIAAHRELARSLVESERWAAAAHQYEAALALDPALEFARVGAERARGRAALDERLESHLARPERLSSEAVRAEVRRLLEQAAALAPAGPRLSAQATRLVEHLARAETPVEVSLESDELTEVTVYRVGSLGRFRRHTLELLPGSYVVVGRRSGYREVRLDLVVGAGAPVEPLTVRCEETI